ncbi:MAG: hypothetical protein J0M02_17215, partial [Planctomycetes bacterium]|nr:hypothetical protein [Planctomycetota bacterium]
VADACIATKPRQQDAMVGQTLAAGGRRRRICSDARRIAGNQRGVGAPPPGGIGVIGRTGDGKAAEQQCDPHRHPGMLPRRHGWQCHCGASFTAPMPR